jgi:two-component system sensor histidine kinase BaeS
LQLAGDTCYGALGSGRRAPATTPHSEEWLAIVAHDLRGPLTGISGWLQLAQRAAATLRQAEHGTAAWAAGIDHLDLYLARLDVSIADLHHTMDTVLDATAAASGTLLRNLAPSDVSLTLLVQAAVTHARAHTSRHAITLEAPAVPLVVRGDRVRLRQLLDNLLANAIKYAPDGGPITVHLEASEPAHTAASVDTATHAGATAKWVTLRVMDSGLGIPADAVPHVFDRFWRAAGATRQLPGSGLGLYVCRAVTIAHGGQIEVERSVPAAESDHEVSGWHGTIIRVTLPLGMQEADSALVTTGDAVVSA